MEGSGGKVALENDLTGVKGKLGLKPETAR